MADIITTSNSYINDDYRIEIETSNNFVYGYGVGINGVSFESEGTDPNTINENDLSYFDVLGISGSKMGLGLTESILGQTGNMVASAYVSSSDPKEIIGPYLQKDNPYKEGYEYYEHISSKYVIFECHVYGYYKLTTLETYQQFVKGVHLTDWAQSNTLSGTYTGFGNISNTIVSTNVNYNIAYGWGYELADFVFSDNIDSIDVVAKVYKNGILSNENGIEIIFDSEPGIIINPRISKTINGIATTTLKVDPELKINTDFKGNNEYFLNRLSSGAFVLKANFLNILSKEDFNISLKSAIEQKFTSDLIYSYNIITNANQNY
jgi:hypothetical protein